MKPFLHRIARRVMRKDARTFRLPVLVCCPPVSAYGRIVSDTTMPPRDWSQFDALAKERPSRLARGHRKVIQLRLRMRRSTDIQRQAV